MTANAQLGRLVTNSGTSAGIPMTVNVLDVASDSSSNILSVAMAG